MVDNISFHVNTAEIAEQFGELKDKVEQVLYLAVKRLAVTTHAEVQRLAEDNLHSSKQAYLDAIDIRNGNGFKEIAPGLWVVDLNESAMWIEEGQEPHSMKEKLLAKNSKISKDGYRYKSIPFSHSKSQDLQTSQEKDLVNEIRSHLKKQKISFKGIETDATGKPRLGRLHRMNIPSKRLKSYHVAPPLQNLSIYQSKGKNGKIRRDVVTFRTISENPNSKSKWFHPGIKPPRKFMDRALEIAMRRWESEILPDILSRF